MEHWHPRHAWTAARLTVVSWIRAEMSLFVAQLASTIINLQIEIPIL